MARASRRAHDGGKRVRPISGVSPQRTARPGPNPRGHPTSSTVRSSKGCGRPEMQASIAKLGFETGSLTAREFGAKLGEEAHSWEAAVNESGVKLDRL